jgi:hypothetical protein
LQCNVGSGNNDWEYNQQIIACGEQYLAETESDVIFHFSSGLCTVRWAVYPEKAPSPGNPATLSLFMRT